MPRRVGCDVNAFDGREKKKKRKKKKWERTEWRNVNPIWTMSFVFLFSLSFALLHPIGRLYLSVLSFLFFSHLLCVRMRMKTEMRSLFSSLFLPCSCQQLVSRKSKKFSASFFFIRVIYMRALKDDARFDLFLTLYTVYMHEKRKKIHINDKSKRKYIE